MTALRDHPGQGERRWKEGTEPQTPAGPYPGLSHRHSWSCRGGDREIMGQKRRLINKVSRKSPNVWELKH